MDYKHTISLTSGLLALLTAILPAACSADTVEDSGIAGTSAADEPVVFSLELCSGLTRTGVADNTTFDNLWPAGKNVYIANSEGAKLYTTGEAPSTSSSVATSMTPAGDDSFIWPTTDKSWRFSGWYPTAIDHAPSDTTVTVNANQSIYDETDNPTGTTNEVYAGYDILYCPSTPVSHRQKPVTLTFLHQLARVVVIINSNYTETKEEVKSVTFGNNKVALTGSVNELGTTPLTNGETTWTVTDQNHTVTMRYNASMSDPDNNVYAFECILPPQSYKESEQVVTVPRLIQITSEKKSPQSGNRYYHYDHAIDMQAGYQYTYNLLISERGLVTLSTVRVTDWTTGTAVSGDADIPDNSYPNTMIQ